MYSDSARAADVAGTVVWNCTRNTNDGPIISPDGGVEFRKSNFSQCLHSTIAFGYFGTVGITGHSMQTSFVVCVNCSGDNGFLYSTSDNWLVAFERCVFLVNTHMTGLFVGHGSVFVRRCIFLRYAGPISGQLSRSWFWNCGFDSNTSAWNSELQFDNLLFYRETVTYSLAFDRSCHPLHVVGNGDEDIEDVQETANGSLTHDLCLAQVVAHDDLDWNPDDGQGGTSKIEFAQNITHGCAVVRRCTFLSLDSLIDGGGAIFLRIFNGTAVVSDCQFTMCGVGVSQQGGAIYMEVERLLCHRNCGTRCTADIGTFVSIWHAGIISRNGMEVFDCSFWKCSTLEVLSGGSVVKAVGGELVMLNVNFSDCQQTSSAAIFSHDWYLAGTTGGHVEPPCALRYIGCVYCLGDVGCYLRSLFGYGF
jgi:hypothetical protein